MENVVLNPAQQQAIVDFAAYLKANTTSNKPVELLVTFLGVK